MKIKKSIIALLMSNLILSSSAIAGHHTEEGFFIRDANGDGVVSKGEYLVSTEKKFKKMDSNSDGEIDRTEYENSAPIITPAKTYTTGDKPQGYEALINSNG